MKKVFLSLVAIFACLALVGCFGPQEDEKKGYDYDAIPDQMEAESYQIGFVTDIGQLKDKSFNQGTWEGIKRYAHENGKSYKYYQPANADAATDDDRYDAMKAAVENGAEIIVCAGFMQGNALAKAAAEFKEEQSGYLAGYAAVMEGYTKLGFSGGGGGTNPACQRFGYGFIQGANDAAKAKNITVSMKYSWLYGAAFGASAELKALLDGWYAAGTEVIFSCGGSMCLSAFAAADEAGKKVIGVDVDQSGQSETVITSAMKGLREGTMYALGKYFDNKWDEVADKAANLGAAEDAVGLPTDTWSLKKFTVKQYEDLLAKIKDGSVKVDNVVEGAETKEYSNVQVEFVE